MEGVKKYIESKNYKVGYNKEESIIVFKMENDFLKMVLLK